MTEEGTMTGDLVDSLESFFDAIRHVEAEQRGRHIPMSCETCGKPTSERKPRCIEHITEMPIAREIASEIQRREAELERVKKSGARAVRLNGTRAQEILDFIRDRESVTIGKVAAEVLLSVSIVKHYIRKLEIAKKVWAETVTSKGHSTLVIHIIDRRSLDDEE